MTNNRREWIGLLLALALFCVAGCGKEEEVKIDGVAHLTESEKGFAPPDEAIKEGTKPQDIDHNAILTKAIEADIHLKNEFYKEGKRKEEWSQLEGAMRKVVQLTGQRDDLRKKRDAKGASDSEVQKAKEELASVEEKLKLAEEDQKAKEEAFATTAAAEAKLAEWRDANIKLVADKLEGSDEAQSSKILGELRKLPVINELLSKAKSRLINLDEFFKELVAGKLELEEAKSRTSELGLVVTEFDTLDSLKAYVAQTMNAFIVDLHSTWSALHATLVKNRVVDAILPFMPPHRLDEFGVQEAYKPVSEVSINHFHQNLKIVANRIPGGNVAGEVAKFESEDEAVRNKSLMSKIGKADEGGMPEARLLRLVVVDYEAAYGSVKPAHEFRDQVVKLYDAKTNLLTPTPLALVAAIFGCVLLFGGLAFSIYRAVKSGSQISVTPTV